MLYWFRSVLHPSSEKKALAFFPTNGRFPKVKKKKSDYQILASLSMNNHFRSIRFKLLTLECPFRLTWYINPKSLIENMYSKIENMNIQNQSITHDYESSNRQSNPGNSVI